MSNRAADFNHPVYDVINSDLLAKYKIPSDSLARNLDVINREFGANRIEVISWEAVLDDWGWNRKTWLREEANPRRALLLPPRYRISRNKWVILRKDHDEFLVAMIALHRTAGGAVGYEPELF